MQPIHLRNVPPPMETFDHTSFLNFIFSYLRPENYLELGVRDGKNFSVLAQHCQNAVGVDIVPAPFQLAPNMTYHTTSTDAYFSTLPPEVKFDAIFIDADHSHAQSLKDFLNSKDRIIDDGFIFFHDTYPYDELMFNPQLCNDVYKTALYLKTHHIDEFEVLTFPFNPGVTVAKKIARTKQLIYK
jgi:predicted O-methyltransferase YrrM